jgi:hypothetical protein
MKLAALRSILTLSIPALLAACGAGGVQEGANASAAIAVSLPAQAVQVSLPAQAAAGQPLPDCQPENCAGLRIIDGNAEAFRIDAMRRAGQDS